MCLSFSPPCANVWFSLSAWQEWRWYNNNYFPSCSVLLVCSLLLVCHSVLVCCCHKLSSWKTLTALGLVFYAVYWLMKHSDMIHFGRRWLNKM